MFFVLNFLPHSALNRKHKGGSDHFNSGGGGLRKKDMSLSLKSLVYINARHCYFGYLKKVGFH